MSNLTAAQERQQKVIGHLSVMISQKSRVLQDERCHPRNNADESDDMIKETDAQVQDLRRIRGELEDLFARW